MRNSRGEWEAMREWVAKPVREIVTPADMLRVAWSVAEVSETSNPKLQASEKPQAPNSDIRQEVEQGDSNAEHGLLTTDHSFVPILRVPEALEKTGTGARRRRAVAADALHRL